MWPWANHWNFPSAHWFLCLQNSCKGTSWGRIRRKVTKWRQLLWVLLAKVLLQIHTLDSRKQRPYKCKIILICTSSPCACQGWRWELCFFFLFWASLSTCNLIPTVFPVIISFLLYLSPLLTLTLSELTHVSRVAERRLELRTNSFAGRRYISPQNEPWAPWLPSVPQLCGSRLVWPGSRLVEGLGHIGNLEVPGLVSTATGQRTEMLCFFLFALNHLFFFFN